MEGWREGQGWRHGGREEGGRSEGGGREWWALVAVRGGGHWVCCPHRPRHPSSPFVVVVRHSNVVRPRHSSLLVGGVRRLRAVVAVDDRVWWPLTIERGGRCPRLRTPFVVRGWLGWALLVTGRRAWVVGGRSFCSRLGVW